MKPQLFHALCAGVLALTMSPALAAAQQPAPRTAGGCPTQPAQFHACAAKKLQAFNPPRTPDGKPNFQGYWERTVTSQDIEEHGSGFGQQAGPSLVIDTPDRKIPYQPWALDLRKGMVERYISPLASCYPPGVPRHVYAPQGHQILQTPGYVVHVLEYSHSYRVIPTNVAPHVPSSVKLFQGDSRGRWEGNTLIVDVTNANGLTWLDNAGNFYSNALHVMERFTMLDADTIHYEARIRIPRCTRGPGRLPLRLRATTSKTSSCSSRRAMKAITASKTA